MSLELESTIIVRCAFLGFGFEKEKGKTDSTYQF